METPTLYERASVAFENGVTAIFYPILSPFFNFFNKLMVMPPMCFATACALGLFIGAMIWVWTLKKEYVNLDAPSKSIIYDLRLWTILSMLPHVIVYFYLTERTN